MKFKKTIASIFSIAIIALLVIPSISHAQSSSLWKFVGSFLQPVVSTWNAGIIDGKFGIGTSSPYAKLSVVGETVAANFTATTTATSTLPRLTSTAFNLGSDYITDFTGTNLSVTNGVLNAASGGSGGCCFASTTASNENVYSVGTGNVGIGSSTPYAKLSVTQTGTAPSFIVEDSTSPDTTPFMISAAGNTSIQTASPLGYEFELTGRQYIHATNPALILRGDAGSETGLGVTITNTDGANLYFGKTAGLNNSLTFSNANQLTQFINGGNTVATFNVDGTMSVGSTISGNQLVVTHASGVEAVAITTPNGDVGSSYTGIKFTQSQNEYNYGAIRSGFADSGGGGYLSLLTGQIGGTRGLFYSRLWLDNLGHAGIGTIAPTAMLHVVGTTTRPTDPIITAASSTGAVQFQIDSRGHHMTGGTAPTCGANCSAIAGDDNSMRVTTGVGVSSATVNFANTWKNTSGTSITPVCHADEENAGTVAVNASSTPSTVVLEFASSLSSILISVSCQASVNFTF